MEKVQLETASLGGMPSSPGVGHPVSQLALNLKVLCSEMDRLLMLLTRQVCDVLIDTGLFIAVYITPR